MRGIKGLGALFLTLPVSGCFFVSKDVEKPILSTDIEITTDEPLEIQGPKSGTEIDGMVRTITGVCETSFGRVSFDGDIVNPPAFAECVDGEFTVEVEFTKPYEVNGILATQSDGEEFKFSRAEYPIVYDRAPYCGDGKINQAWETCETGSANCTSYCMSPTELASSPMRFAIVTLNDARSLDSTTGNTIENEAERPLPNAVFIHSSTKSIPQGVPFPVTNENGTPLKSPGDPHLLSMARGVIVSYGISPFNSCGYVHLLLHKSQNSSAWRHTLMSLKFTKNGTQFPATWFFNDNVSDWPMEGPTDTFVGANPILDEATKEADGSYTIYYTTAGAHDAAYYGYECVAP